MSKKYIPVIFCFFVCLAALLTLSQQGKSKMAASSFFSEEEEKTEGHIGICMDCHFLDSLHNNKGHGGPNDCDMCHDGEAVTGNVKATSCIVSGCHPIGDPGKCNLANFHSYEACLRCHYKCLESSVTTTSVPASFHMGICLECHLTYDLHVNTGHHASCTDCHDGEPVAGNVKAYTCYVCHPIDDPDKCSLVDFHSGASCSTCHAECAGDNSTTTTTNPPLTMHNGICAECHPTDDFPNDALHANESHLDCKICHAGAYQAGNVKARTCIVSGCHPIGDPGKCNLVETLDNDTAVICLKCHYDCSNEAVTTSVTGTTTKVPSFTTHIGLCSDCHSQDDLHKNKGHDVCTLCHDISSQGENDAGPVTATSCTVCHPINDPDKCNLSNFHGTSNCLDCHFECIKRTASTTTTTAKVSTTTTQPQTTTTTTAWIPCPLNAVLQDDIKSLETLRAFRDKILSNSKIGRTYVSLYYQHAPEITFMILSDQALKTEASDLLALMLPEIRVMLEAGRGTFSAKTMAKSEILIDRISEKAGPGLKSAIRRVKADMNKFRFQQ